jgi:uncharacterized protein DUF6714
MRTPIEPEEVPLLEAIRAAFHDVPYPGDGPLMADVSCPCDEGKEIAEAFAGLHWEKVPLELLVRKNSCLSFFTPEAFAFYLPAHMLFAITRLSEIDIALHSTLHALIPPTKSEMVSWWRSRISRITRVQGRVIHRFLQWAEILGLDPRIDRALTFWDEFVASGGAA